MNLRFWLIFVVTCTLLSVALLLFDRGSSQEPPVELSTQVTTNLELEFTFTRTSRGTAYIDERLLPMETATVKLFSGPKLVPIPERVPDSNELRGLIVCSLKSPLIQDWPQGRPLLDYISLNYQFPSLRRILTTNDVVVLWSLPLAQYRGLTLPASMGTSVLKAGSFPVVALRQ